METSETTIIEKVAEKFKSDLPNRFSLKPEDKWIISKGYVSLDLAIYYNSSLYAIVEVKINLSSVPDSCIMERLKKCVNKLECVFGILTDGQEYYLYDSINDKWGKLENFKCIKEICEYHSSLVMNRICPVCMRIIHVEYCLFDAWYLLGASEQMNQQLHTFFVLVHFGVGWRMQDASYHLNECKRFV